MAIGTERIVLKLNRRRFSFAREGNAPGNAIGTPQNFEARLPVPLDKYIKPYYLRPKRD